MNGTKFVEVYNRFFGKITDDMYLEYTPQNTVNDLRALLEDAIPNFEFPRKKLNYIIKDSVVSANSDEAANWNATIPENTSLSFLNETINNGTLVDESYFEEELTSEEINILAILMMCGWLQRQITSVENTRMKYSGSDFKMTSQANHLSKLLALLNECHRQSHKMQRLYKRRKTDENGYIRSNWSVLRENSALDD